MFSVSKSEFVAEDEKVLDDLEALAELCKVEKIYLKEAENVTQSDSASSSAQDISRCISDQVFVPNPIIPEKEDVFPIFDIVREARARLKGKMAEEVFATLNSCDAASDHHPLILTLAERTYLLIVTSK